MKAYIMVGGKSRRMGQDKNFLIINKTTLLSRIITTCEEVCSKVTLVANSTEEKEKFESFKKEIIFDKPGIDGPLGGVMAVLNNDSDQTCFVTSVDLIDLNQETILKLISTYKNENFLGIKEGKDIQPLCGIYNSSALPVLEQSASRGEYRMREIIKNLKAKVIDPVGKQWRNLNYPAEYEGIKQS